ncbi:MAG: XrtA/PEP-CTERM system exopolysaccharide export protein [Steroidobacteraceae bacterium]
MMTRLFSRIACAGLVPWLASACLAAQDAPVEAPAAATATNYIIGPGDTIQVFVWRNPELSVTVPVRPDGKVSTPLVEDMIAVGKPPSELARDIEARLSEYIRSPQVNIIVTNARSSFSQVTVIGQVKSPQTVPYREGMRMMDVLLAVGGLTEFAAGNRARLIRKDPDGVEQEFKVRLKDLLTKGRLDQNLEVRPGDVLIVPESVF